MKNSWLLAFALLLAPVAAHSATGDILFQCSFDGAGSTPYDVVKNCGATTSTSINTVAAIVTDGVDGKKAISYYYPNTGSEVVSSFTTPALNKPQLTVDYWEKFDVAGTVSTIWNVKSIRAYVGPGSGDYMAAMMVRHNAAKWYQSTWGTGTLGVTDSVSSVNTGTAYCVSSGTFYTCNNGRMEVGTEDWGTTWHNVRVFIKVPSSSTASDGQTIVWIDGKLIYTLSDLAPSSLWSTGWVPYTTTISFHPSDDFFQNVTGTKVPFHHLYDEIKIYEGFVPPGLTPPVLKLLKTTP